MAGSITHHKVADCVTNTRPGRPAVIRIKLIDNRPPITLSERSRTILQRHYASCVLLTQGSSSLSNAFGASSASECVARSAGRGLPLRVTPMLFMPAARAASMPCRASSTTMH